MERIGRGQNVVKLRAIIIQPSAICCHPMAIPQNTVTQLISQTERNIRKTLNTEHRSRLIQTSQPFVGSEFVTAELLKLYAFWDVTCDGMSSSGRFGKSRRLRVSESGSLRRPGRSTLVLTERHNVTFREI